MAERYDHRPDFGRHKFQHSQLSLESSSELRDQNEGSKSKRNNQISQKNSHRNVHNDGPESNIFFKPKLPKSFYIIKLREWAEEIPIIGLQQEWENNIMKLIFGTRMYRNPHYVQVLFREVREMYMNEMQEFAIRSTVVECDQKSNVQLNDMYTLDIVKTADTLRIMRFMKHRHAMENKYFLSHPVMRQIIDLSLSALVPRMIVDLSHYHAQGVTQFSELRARLKIDLKTGSCRIENEYYKQIIETISNSKSLREMPPHKTQQLMHCATNLFVQQVLHIKMDTVKNVISAMKCDQHRPRIEFVLVHEGMTLTMKPSIDEVKTMYNDIIWDIDKVGQDLISFEINSLETENFEEHHNCMQMKMPDWFMNESQDELERVISALLQPLDDHCRNINAHFTYICSHETRSNILDSIIADYNFDFYYEHVEKFNIYLKRANAILPYIHYRVGQLHQIPAKETLKDEVTDIIHILVKNLVHHHWEYNSTICREFEKFQSDALDIPNNAKSLFELNDNMAVKSKIIIDSLEDKVRESITMLITLSAITNLTDEHMSLSTNTINWLCSIQDILIQSNTLCEAMKSELEDELQKKTNTLSIDIDDMFPSLIILNDMDDANRVHEYSNYLKVLTREIEQIDERIEEINVEERLFKFPETHFTNVSKIKKIFLPFYTLNHTILDWRKYNAVWLDGPFEYINPTEVQELIHFYLEKLSYLNKSIKSYIKSDMSSCKLFKFIGVIDDPDPMQQPAPMKLCFQALEQINEFKQYLPLIECICNSALELRHWKEMSKIYGSDITPNAGTTLRKLIALNLIEYIDQYRVISISANKELALHRQLQDMYEQWKHVSFALTYDDVGRLIFINCNEIQVRLDEHLVIIQETKGSYFVKPIELEVEKYHACLIQIRDIIKYFNIIQNECSFLRPIFDNKEITIEELMDAATIYDQVQVTIEDIAQSISGQSTFRDIGQSSEYIISLLATMEKIEVIIKNVHTYLNNMRLFFPRFFFQSDDELVTILFEKCAIRRVERLFEKCFHGVRRIKANSSETKIIAIISDHHEELNLKEKILCHQGARYDWMKLAESGILNAVRDEIYKYIDIANMEADVSSVPIDRISIGISGECSIQLIWTSQIQRCLWKFNRDKLNLILNMQNILINNAVEDLRNDLIMKRRILLMGLLSVMFRQREIIDLLILKNISKHDEFDWIMQLRYYWNDNDVTVGLMNESRQYGYEFSSITEPTINTPLNDRCYRTCIEVARHHLFAALIGHTATGKTEAIRGLTRALAVPSHIINCSKNLNCELISRIFEGVISLGAWVCFKNINVLSSSLLSALVHRVRLISQTLSSNCSTVSFECSQLRIKSGGFITTTVNYHHSSVTLHQHDLPENFRALFRVIVFQRPDISKICETRLFASGFTNAKKLTTKIQLLYNLCIEQFSYAKHYDFGCRTINAVIRSAINIKFGNPSYDEETIVIRSLIDVNSPMFSNLDMITFQRLLQDIFPGVKVPATDYKPFLDVLARVAKTKNILPHKLFKLKIIQVLEMSYLRRVLMLIGDALSGKTTLLQTLVQCSSENTQLQMINHAAMTPQNLFGYLDEKSSRWCDGIYTTLLRDQNNDVENMRKFVVFDGPVESIWMENFNSILNNDDSGSLMLPTGETLDMSERMSVIFETDNIEQASPAIISRCGIIILAQECFSYKHHITAWVLNEQVLGEHKEFIQIFLNWSLGACLNFVYDACQFIISVDKVYLVVSTLRLCGIYLRDAANNMDEKNCNNFGPWCQAAVIQSIIWTFSACLSTDSRECLNEFCTTLWSNNNINFPVPEKMKQCGILLPSEGMIQDNMYIFKGTGCWKQWDDTLKTESGFAHISTPGLPFVPTTDTVKHLSMLIHHIKHRIPFIICGEISTGKTTLMQFLSSGKLSGIDYMMNFFNFPRTTVAHQAQNLFLLKLNRIMGDRYAPPKNKFCINFIDDLNIYAANSRHNERKSLLELIRQYNDHTYWYNLNKPEKLYIENVMFSCALTLNGSRNGGILCPRFMRHFNLYSLCVPTRENIVKIFSSTLLYKLKKNLFTAEVVGSVNAMVNATMDVYRSVIEKLRPTPKNFQYHFSIKDISRVIDGCSLIQRESAETKITLIRLWVHESMRVFGDRLTNQVDREFLLSHIKSAIKVHFKDTFESLFDHLPKENDQLTQESLKNLVFTNLMETEKESNVRRYEEVGSIQLLKNKIIHYLNELNNNCKLKMDILLLPDVLEHLIRICRILTIPGGNLLMICAGGTGRKSLTRLAAYIERHDFFQYTTDQYFDSNEWRQNLKCMIKTCGGVGKQCTFFIPTRYLKNSYFDDIDSLMIIGEVPQLISPDERQMIAQIARLPAQKGDRTLEISITDVMEYFFTQCREKLHFILYHNVSNGYDNEWRTQLYPSVLKYCHFDYFAPWANDAFLQLGYKYVEEVSIENIDKEKIVVACKHFYDQSQKVSAEYYNKRGKVTHITPQAFIHMIQLYSVRMSDEQEVLMATKNRYLSGLEKLRLAAEQVSQMQETLQVLRPELELSAQKTVETMREIESENIIVENTTIQVKREEQIAGRTAKIAATLKSECESDLAVAIPILEDAIAALNTLKPSDITLVKAMKNPPDTVKLVMAAVCVMLDVPAERVIDPITGRKSMDYWGPSKRVLGDMNFLQTLKDYDKDNISPAVMQIIKKTYMTDKNFMPHIVTKASSAAEGLCKWVRAMVSYDEVAKIVAPKKTKLAAAEKECNECMVFLNETRKTLAALNDKLSALNMSLQATLANKFELENEVEKCTQKLVKAEALIMSLADEKSKWMQSAKELEQSYNNLAGDILISCGIIAYLAPYHLDLRNESVVLWIEYARNHLNIPCSSNYDFVGCLESEVKISSWHQCGLPKDRFAHENAAILNNSMQFCLFIDPQDQANNWIRKMEQHNGLTIVKLTDPSFLQNIVRCIEHNQSILVENIDDDEFSAISIDYILLQVRNNRGRVHHHEKDCSRIDTSETKDSYSVEHNDKVRVYMTTKLENPHFHHYVFSKLTIINFALTEDALQGRLLDILISREKPEMHETFDLLIDKSASNMRLLKQEEDNILTILSTSTINILQDDKSMEILDISKNHSLKIVEDEKCVKLAKNKIDIFRQNYTEFTRYCATLYSTLLPLSNLNCCYRFSLEWFIQIYLDSIVQSRRSVSFQQRVQYLMSSFTTTLHSSVLIVLFDEHRLLYSFLLCLEIQKYNGHVNVNEIDFFTFNNSITESDIDVSVKPHWLPEKSWKEINSVSKSLSAFHLLESSIKNDESLWLDFYKARNPHVGLLPKQWQEFLTPFQILIIFKIVRPDRTSIEIERFIMSMNLALNIHPTLKISDSYSQSSCFIPLIFVLPSYIEPYQHVQKLAATIGYASKLKVLSLGDNMEEEAYTTMLHAQKYGEWVLLENCHFANAWMSKLETFYEAMDISNTHLEFRLWLSTGATRQFPTTILQNGVKVISDAPKNFKQFLVHCYSNDPLNETNIFASCPGKDKIFAKLIYAFSSFHVLLRERNYFGINGWNVNYDLCHSDLAMSIRQLKLFMKSCDTSTIMSLDPLLYIVGECNYGGKCIDFMDHRCLITIFQDYCNTNIMAQDNYLLGVDYCIPNRCERRDFIEHIMNLPDYSSPELFGISENTMINRDTLITDEFFSQFSFLNRSTTNINSLMVKSMSTVDVDMVRDKLPLPLNIEGAKKKCCEQNPFNEVLVQEVLMYNSTLEYINESLIQPDDELIRSLQLNTLPNQWNSHSIFHHHRSLSNFIEHLHKKYNFFHEWINGECPASFSLGMFALPRRFISMSRVMFAKNYKTSINQIEFVFQVSSMDGTDTSQACQSDGKVLYLHDLQLSGASWDADSKMLMNNHKFLAQVMPVILWRPKLPNEKLADNNYSCPLYKSNISRDLIDHAGNMSNFIIQVPLPTNLSEDFWIKRGTALFCHTECHDRISTGSVSY